MRLQDTLSNSEQMLDISKKIRVYLCGVTVYDESHIGHARTIIVFDVLRKYLESKGITVDFVQNFTDVDDKIINRAESENTTTEQISSRYIQNYFDDFDGLNVKRATNYPKATEHIEDIKNFIKKLIEKDIAYVSKNGVYFSVSKFPQYGKLSKKKIDELQSGARIEVDESKKDPLDFALWKFSDVKPLWDSPWGKGRPGWHIECSAMSIRYLGENFDIHGGGRDLIFPHHENEIAQSESFTEKQFAKIWMHVGMVTINGEELLKENLIKWRQAEICYYELIHANNKNHNSEIKSLIEETSNEFDNALESDFNTHLALLAFFKLIKEVNHLAAEEKLDSNDAKIIIPEFERILEILGLIIPKITLEQKQEIDDLITNREQLRREKKFQEADKIRDRLNEMNIELIDHKGKTIWIRKEKIKADIQ